MAKQKIVLITGASSGIGKATAFKLIEDGHIVYTAARRLNKMDDLKAKGARPYTLDITKEGDIQNVVGHILAKHEAIDVLINNAGYAIYGAMEDTRIEDARRQFEVNLFGLARLTQLVLPKMREKGEGTIINLSSMAGKIYTPLGSWYHATKHALEGWSDSLRLELKPFGINVVIIEPGAIKTEFDEVMKNPLLERSGDGPYGVLAHRIANATEKIYTRKASDPELIADLISKAIKSNNPKTRYVAGYMAKPAIFFRKWIPDSWMDKIILKMG
ncbi:oxidoreductase [Luteibaculum oceani]|uniref:SDR family NAD(P)-dependent oxidoreductase n=1 Tax=Luteibaculum oceani TaxID=1294296 RepID=A0A5C6VNN7_9FLAO|nr:oxidoreductase [Luteibaculum oceani]TXC85225.1 SDR family NAD(P)-dependent oxidoreductase [Luteibaculum oceani]